MFFASKNIIVLTAALLYAAPALAQYMSDTTAYTEKIKHAKETKSTGATLTITGSIVLVTGMVTAQNSLLETGGA